MSSIVHNGTLARPPLRGSTPIRVLMADPDESLPLVYREPLSREGFQLITATDGSECIARLRERVPEALVLEPQMLRSGDGGVLAMISETPDLARIPLMILTSCRDPNVLNGAAHYPISDYYVKPLAPDRLAGRLRGLLNHPRQRFTLAEQSGRLACLIARRTAGRVQNLRVEIIDGRVLVYGCTASFHVKQLVIAALLEASEASQVELGRLELDIIVRGD